MDPRLTVKGACRSTFPRRAAEDGWADWESEHARFANTEDGGGLVERRLEEMAVARHEMNTSVEQHGEYLAFITGWIISINGRMMANPLQNRIHLHHPHADCRFRSNRRAPLPLRPQIPSEQGTRATAAQHWPTAAASARM